MGECLWSVRVQECSQVNERLGRGGGSSFTWPTLLAALWSPGWAAGSCPHTEPPSWAGCCSAHSVCGERTWVQPRLPTGLCPRWTQAGTFRQHRTNVLSGNSRSETTHQEHCCWLSEDMVWLWEVKTSSPERESWTGWTGTDELGQAT